MLPFGEISLFRNEPRLCPLLAGACLYTSQRCSSGGGVVKPAVARVPEPDRCDGRDRDMPRDVPSHEGAEAAAPGVGSSKRLRRALGLTRAARRGTGGPSSREQPRAMGYAGGHRRTGCRAATTALSTGCSRRSECCERSMGTRPPSDAAAIARCVGELCAPQNTRPRAKVYTVMRVASTRSARYLRGGSPEGDARCGAAWAGWVAFGAAVRVVGAEVGEAHGTIRAVGSRATHGPTRRRQRRAAPGREAEQHRLRMAEAPSRERQWAARREAASTRR